MSFVHFPLNIQGCFIEQKVKKSKRNTVEENWSSLLSFSHLAAEAAFHQTPALLLPPSLLPTSLPYFSFPLSSQLLSWLCLTHAFARSLSLSPCEAVNTSLFLYESAIQSIALLLCDRWQWSIIPSVNIIQQHQLTLLSFNTPYWWAPSRCNYTFFKLFFAKTISDIQFVKC